MAANDALFLFLLAGVGGRVRHRGRMRLAPFLRSRGASDGLKVRPIAESGGDVSLAVPELVSRIIAIFIVSFG